MKPDGLPLSVDEFYPNKRDGDKTERMAAILGPRYDNRVMWHFRGGHCQTLEEELILLFPPHDDVMDALTNAVQIATPPIERKSGGDGVPIMQQTRNARFGGF
jgi:hypothetical protein